MSELRILSHNVFWFQGAAFATDRPPGGRPPILSALVEIHLRLAPDVLALQEVQDEATFKLLAGSLEMTGRHCPGGELGQYGGATFWREGRYVADSQSSPPVVQRMWQIVEARPAGGAGVRICNIHLPSSRQLGEARAGRRRVRELLGVLERADPPAVVLGDFNEQPGGPVGRCLSRRGYLDAAVLAGRADRPTSLGGGRGDQIWIHRTLRDRLAEYGVLDRTSIESAGGGAPPLSDHFPLWITLAPAAAGDTGS